MVEELQDGLRCGVPLIGTGACPFEADSLSLDSRGITSISDEAVAVFANMGQLQSC